MNIFNLSNSIPSLPSFKQIPTGTFFICREGIKRPHDANILVTVSSTEAYDFSCATNSAFSPNEKVQPLDAKVDLTNSTNCYNKE